MDCFEDDPVRRFTDLYDAYHPRVFAYVVSRAGRRYAEEIVSETFTIAWRRLADVPDAALPWLLGVARNVTRDAVRAEVRREALAAELRTWADREDRAVGDVADGVVERAAVLRALAALSDDDREVLTLVAWHGLTSTAAARVVGCSRAAYFVRLHRARRRLARALAADRDGPGRDEPPEDEPPGDAPFAAPPPVRTLVAGRKSRDDRT